MKKFIGIDLGTSALKALVCDENNKALFTIEEKYEVISNFNHYSEQNPNDWIIALDNVFKKINGKVDEIEAISFSGQMHGLVILDKNDNVIRNCILWNDNRAVDETNYLNEIFDKNKLSSITGNMAYAGFTLPKLLWVKKQESINFSKIDKIMLPKDYLVYYLTKKFVTDYSDASGTLFLDINTKKWSEEICKLAGISTDKLPKLVDSFSCVGNISQNITSKYSFLKNTKVIVGGADNAIAAIGTGTINEGECNISLGTSGTILFSNDNLIIPEKNSLHSFCHANGKYYLMGCILSAASSRKWWLEEIIKSNDYYSDEKAMNNARTNNLYFLPYLSGERSPHNDSYAKGAFIGLTSTTKREEMSLAVIEGVSFALKDSLEIARLNGKKINSATLCGGGSKSKLWCQKLATILGLKIRTLDNEQGPSQGAVYMAMLGSGLFTNLNTIKQKFVFYSDEYIPNEEERDYYLKKYDNYKKLYPLLKDFFKTEI